MRQPWYTWTAMIWWGMLMQSERSRMVVDWKNECTEVAKEETMWAVCHLEICSWWRSGRESVDPAEALSMGMLCFSADAECSRRGIYRDEDQSSFAFCAPALILHLPLPAVFARQENTTPQTHPQVYMKSRSTYPQVPSPKCSAKLKLILQKSL